MRLKQKIVGGIVGLLVGLLVLPIVSILEGWLSTSIAMINTPPYVAYTLIALGILGATIGVIANTDDPYKQRINSIECGK